MAELVHVLLVEDNAGDARLVREALREAAGQNPSGPDYRVTSADRLAKAFHAIGMGGIDIILLDLDLPDSNGYATFERVQARAPDCPIIVLTRNDDYSIEARALREGAQDYLAKSQFDAASLARSLRYARDRKQAERDRLELARASAAHLAAENSLRRAEEANRAKDEFLSVASHELRTPLSAILGWARLLRSGALPESQREKALEVIERNAKVQVKLVEDILDVSRIITGKLRLETGPIDAVAAAEAAVDVVRPAAEAKGVRIVLDLDPDVGTLQGDAGRFQQIVWNLLSNGVKFTPRGGEVRLRVRRARAAVELSVTDTGQGIDRAFLPHVFEPFRQADATSTRSHAGLGLGLAIVKHLVELHGGVIDAESDGAGRGSTFTVRIPCLDARPTSVPPRPALVSDLPQRVFTCPPELRGLHVLVIDDQPDTRELLQSLLERCDVRTTTAASAHEGFRLFRDHTHDVVISDIGMPGEDGYDLIRRIRALPRDAGGGTPAIALTAYARIEDRTRALHAGFTNHVTKPVEPLELLTAIGIATGRILDQ